MRPVHDIAVVFMTVLLAIHCRFLRIFVLRERNPREVIIDCGYVMHFLYFWKKDIQIRKVADVKNNILTAETYQDMLSVTQSVILAARVFAERFPNVLLDPSRYVAESHGAMQLMCARNLHFCCHPGRLS